MIIFPHQIKINVCINNQAARACKASGLRAQDAASRAAAIYRALLSEEGACSQWGSWCLTLACIPAIAATFAQRWGAESYSSSVYPTPARRWVGSSLSGGCSTDGHREPRRFSENWPSGCSNPMVPASHREESGNSIKKNIF